MNEIVIHVPHASTYIPEDVFGQFGMKRSDLEWEAYESADLYADRLAAEAWPNAIILQAPVSRIVIDVEHYPVHEQEMMVQAGRGMINTAAHDGRRLERKVSQDLRADLQKRFHDPHWTDLRAVASGRVLIDLHAYPSEAWANEPDTAAPRPQIAIGATEGLTPEGWARALVGYFETLGFDVGRNTPYSGVIDAGAKAAIKLQIRRDLIGEPGTARWRRLVDALSWMPLEA